MTGVIEPRTVEVGDVRATLAQVEAERDAKGALLAFMAHEFRQPLMAIGGMVELMRDTQLSPDQREMLDVMLRGVTGLNDIVTNVLDLARLTAGKLQIAAAPFDLHAAVETCIDLLAVRAAEKDLELIYAIDAAVPPRLKGDAGRFRQVLINLVGNAIKYTERGSVHVGVHGTPRPDGTFELSVAVTDTGPGIAEEDLDCLFQPYVVGDHPCGFGDASTGLGLAICRELVDRMGGRCWAESEVGRGSTFRFTMATRVVGEALAPRAADPDLVGKRLLVVDDSEVAGRHVVALAERWGVLAESATGGARALALLDARQRYDAILIDRDMPGLDGRALATKIRAMPGTQGIPLILMTTLRHGSRGIGTGGSGLRFAAYLSKPVKPARLREVIGAVLTAAATEAETREPGCGRPSVADVADPHRGEPLRQAERGADAASDGELAHTRVVVADDDPLVRRILERVLRRAGAVVTGVGGGVAALELVQRERPDVVILDAIMPELDGFEVCRRLKRDPATRLIPVVLATGLDVDEHRVRAHEAGADDILAKPFDVSRVLSRVRSLARAKTFTDRLEPVEAVIVAMAQCIEGKDPNTHGHCERLATYAERLGQRLGLSQQDLDALRLAGIVHDIGKVAVPDAILLKPGPLTEDEWDVMRRHPLEGERICAGLASFRRVLPIIRYHHERLDGQGYPDRLCGEEIPLTARVLQIVDIYDALTTTRPYRIPLGSREALDYMVTEVERGWRDARVFAAFREMVEEDLAAAELPKPALAASA
jgi:putative two-component system response regulator